MVTSLKDFKVCIVGLGYVGLPLAVLTSKKYPVIGFDISAERIKELKENIDLSSELTKKEIASSKISFTSNFEEIEDCNLFIVTVPTPIKKNNKPDLSSLKNASRLVGKKISNGDLVVFESTVYPGVTEEICFPIIQQESGLKINEGFFGGYSPERVNPGREGKKLTEIVKVTSGSNRKSSELIDKFYKSLIPAGTFKASSIQVAEASKVVENIQRDLNISLMNELSIIFGHLGLNTKDVIDASSTKWNFKKYMPGLVGGHCISIDPYYLAFKSLENGHIPDIILSARKLNEKMSSYISKRILKGMKKKKIKLKKAKVLVLGYTFKEDCKDTRNTKVKDLAKNLKKKVSRLDIFDPLVLEADKQRSELDFITSPKKNFYDCIIIAVSHKVFLKKGINQIKNYGKKNAYFFDLKSSFDKKKVDDQL